MKNPKKLRLQIFRSDVKDKSSSNSPSLHKVVNVKENDDRSTHPSTETNVDEMIKINDEELPEVSQLQLFRYASKFEIFLMVFGGFCAIGNGLVVPASCYTFGLMIDVMINATLESEISGPDSLTEATRKAIFEGVELFVFTNCGLFLLLLILTYISIMLFNYTGQRQTFRIRQLYLKSVLHQDISWYDYKMKSGNVATELTEDVIKFEEGIGEKFAIYISQLASFAFSIIVAFLYGWKLTLVSLAPVPMSVLVLLVVSKINSTLSRTELNAFGAASSVAEEVISAIKTVVAFGAQNTELKRYKKHLDVSYKINVKIGLSAGCGFGLLWFVNYGSYALSLWYGIVLILDQRHLPLEEQQYNAGIIMTVFFCTMVGSTNISATSPYIEIFSVSKAAAAKIFSVIERKSKINSTDPSGVKLTGFHDSIVFNDVEFQYPSRPDVQVLKKLNFTIKKGQTVALVGNSGCGKSTCIQLLQRFYDPLNGQILFDGCDLRDLNIAWLRNNMGIVGQEPVLFDATIAENIRYGNLEATMDMIVNATKMSNAHDFIMKLPSKYDTLVGEKGAQISGGQKQRIAIARALIRDPPILLLDEATSALDTRSESKVQAALDQAHTGRTTIIVAHRLTTIRDADKIIVISEGNVVEEGRHDELMKLKGHYHALVTTQITELSESQQRRSTTNSQIEEIDEDLEPVTIKSEILNEETHPTKSKDSIDTWKVLMLNKPEWKIILVAGLASIIVGGAVPLFVILLGDIMKIMAGSNDEIVREQSNLYAIYFISTGIVIGIATFLQIFLLTIAGESLTTRLRGFAFEAILRQEMAWFDEPANGSGALCAKLSTEAAAVKGATGQRIGTIIQSIATLSLAIGLGIYYDWRLGLVGTAFIPVILYITHLYGRMCKNETLNYHKNLEKSTKIAVEAVSNIRTVVGLGREETFYNRYVNAVIPSFKEAKRNTHFRGLVFGLYKSIGFVAYSAVFYYGGVLLYNDNIGFTSIFKVAQVLVVGATVVGEVSAFSPNLQKGIIAAGKMIRLIERCPKIQDPDDPLENSKNEADARFNDVNFEYSTRPGVTVLNSLNLEIQAGKTIALVGSSGCGKSTIIKLLERFYDPSSGTVDLSGTNIAAMTQSSLRMSLGLVEQEPTVFARTISENIAYGDNSRDIQMEEIISVAKKANIHNFVASLPLGYETELGDKGTMLSGGQKQRIAIARALVRNPKILLLDEATSALDTESEKIVQAALDEAKTGRTCVLIAHRLSTVEDADKIFVFGRGSILESGNHKQLVENRGLYYEMLCIQSGKK